MLQHNAHRPASRQVTLWCRYASGSVMKAPMRIVTESVAGPASHDRTDCRRPELPNRLR
jgi:hypothetical protein